MTALPSFIPAGNLAEVFGAVIGSDIDEEAAARALISFHSNIPPDAYVVWEGKMKRIDDHISAVVDDNGDIVLKTGGPVRLLANDNGLNVRNIQWQMRVDLPAQGIPPLPAAAMRSFWFNAVTNDETLMLATVTPVVGLPVNGTTPGGGSGAPAAAYVHTQSAAASTWTITHPLGLKPTVSVWIADKLVITDVDTPDTATVVITFASPQTGRARLT